MKLIKTIGNEAAVNTNTTSTTKENNMKALFIGKGKLAHHRNCGMIIAAINSAKAIKEVEFNDNMSTCKQCRHHFTKAINEMTIGLTTIGPIFRVAIIAPFQLESINEERINFLLSAKKNAYTIRIGISTNGKNYPFHLAMDSFCHDNGYQLVGKLQGEMLPTEVNEYLIRHCDAVIIFNDGHWIIKKAIIYAMDNKKRMTIMEV